MHKWLAACCVVGRQGQHNDEHIDNLTGGTRLGQGLIRRLVELVHIGSLTGPSLRIDHAACTSPQEVHEVHQALRTPPPSCRSGPGLAQDYHHTLRPCYCTCAPVLAPSSPSGAGELLAGLVDLLLGGTWGGCLDGCSAVWPWMAELETGTRTRTATACGPDMGQLL